MEKQTGKPIKGFERYSVCEDGTVRNRDGYALKIDKSGCICFHINELRKTYSVARLIAIYYLDMPDDKKYRAYRKDISGGYTIDNIAWK